MRWFALFSGVFILIIVSGLVFIRLEEKQIRERIARELAAIVEFKRDQIMYWRAERLADASVSSTRKDLADAAVGLMHGDSPEARTSLLDAFTSLQRHYGYGAVLLTDAKGGVLLRVDSAATRPDDPGTLVEAERAAVLAAVSGGAPVLSDLYTAVTVTGETEIRMIAVAPLSRRRADRTEVIGAVVMTILPERFLFSLLQTWPVPSRSAETLLVRRDGDAALFLNELRHRSGAALALRLPLARRDLPASRAILGETGFFLGVDYRDLPVFSSLIAVPEADWFLVAKIDQDEALAEARAYAYYVITIACLVIVMLAAAAMALWERISSRGLQALIHSERARRKSEESVLWLSRAVEQSPVSIVITDLEGKIEYVNPAFTRATGYAPEEILGKNPRFLKSGEMSKEAYTDLWRQIRMGEEWRGELHNRRKDGTFFWEYASISGVRDAAGRMSHFIAVKEDITERKRIEAELLQAVASAQGASRAKSDFVAHMSHELRTPLNSVIGFANLLIKNKAGNLGATDLDYLHRISTSGKHLLGLINSILDISKIEAGKIEVVRTSTDLTTLVVETVRILERNARPGVALTAEVPDHPVQVMTDPAKMRQILVNLIGNALKFTEHGSVTVRFMDDPRTGKPVSIAIADTGTGIPAEDLGRIFEAFEQVETGATRRFEGTGLGLAITRALAQALGCRIEVESELGKGSTFRLNFTW